MSEPPPRTPPDAHGPAGPPGDRREEFARESRQAPRDAAAERAFIQGRIGMIRTDPCMTDAEKERVIAELQHSLRTLDTDSPDGPKSDEHAPTPDET
ncbi:hypothetical protein [Streptomyces sp. NPDC056194]|uniref:hypothetical protein n=1 Tax=unclassified Streptomyces TaxID=2593676 RepID=UPI0035DFF4A1